MLLYPLVVRELALRLVLDVIVACVEANAAATSPTPVIVTLAAATDATLKAELVVRVFCLALSPAEITVMMSVPPR